MASKVIFSPDIWHQCDAIYAKRQAHCLQLQETLYLKNHAHKKVCQAQDLHFSVNLYLLAVWLDTNAKITLDLSLWQQLQTEVQQWESAELKPFRQQRKQAKGALRHDDYQTMLKHELNLERQCQQFILKRLNQLYPQHIYPDTAFIEAKYLATCANLTNQQKYLSLFTAKRHQHTHG